MGVPRIGAAGAIAAPIPASAWHMPVGAGPLPARVIKPRTLERDQAAENSCMGFALGGAVNTLLHESGFIASPRGLYASFRRRSGFQPTQDNGAYVEPSMHSLRVDGIGTEVTEPYVAGQFAKPISQAYVDEAKDHKILHWYRSRTVAALRQAHASLLPVAGMFEIPPGFAQTGEDGIWHDSGGRGPGGHAVEGVGYDDARQVFHWKNSWRDWGVRHPDDPNSAEAYFETSYDVFESSPRWWDCVAISAIDLVAGS